MTAFLVAWTLVVVVACFILTAVVVVVEVREHRKAQPVRPAPVQRIPAQRSAAAIVPVHDAAAFDEFLRELILTTHVEDVLR